MTPCNACNIKSTVVRGRAEKHSQQHDVRPDPDALVGACIISRSYDLDDEHGNPVLIYWAHFILLLYFANSTCTVFWDLAARALFCDYYSVRIKLGDKLFIWFMSIKKRKHAEWGVPRITNTSYIPFLNSFFILWVIVEVRLDCWHLLMCLSCVKALHESHYHDVIQFYTSSPHRHQLICPFWDKQT